MTRVVAPRGPYQKGIRRRREIVDAASRIFARYGYGGGSLRQIADDVGVTPAASARHFENKYGLLQAVLVHWEEEVDRSFDGARGLEYFRGLPGLMHDHTTEPGLMLTLATEATDPQHPARNWAVQRYARVIDLGVASLREARDLGEIGPMTDEQIEIELYTQFSALTLGLDERLDALEQRVLREADDEELAEITAIRHRAAVIRRTVTPGRDLAARMPLILSLPGTTSETQLYAEDINDELQQAVAGLTSIEERCIALLALHASLASKHLAIVSRRLATVATIFLPISFLVGFWGQNFNLLTGSIEKGWHRSWFSA